MVLSISGWTGVSVQVDGIILLMRLRILLPPRVRGKANEEQVVRNSELLRIHFKKVLITSSHE